MESLKLHSFHIHRNPSFHPWGYTPNKYQLSKVFLNGVDYFSGRDPIPEVFPPFPRSESKVDLIHEMKRSNKRRGLATLCIGGGQGAAKVGKPGCWKFLGGNGNGSYMI